MSGTAQPKATTALVSDVTDLLGSLCEAVHTQNAPRPSGAGPGVPGQAGKRLCSKGELACLDEVGDHQAVRDEREREPWPHGGRARELNPQACGRPTPQLHPGHGHGRPLLAARAGCRQQGLETTLGECGAAGREHSERGGDCFRKVG